MVVASVNLFYELTFRPVIQAHSQADMCTTGATICGNLVHSFDVVVIFNVISPVTKETGAGHAQQHSTTCEKKRENADEE